MESRHRIRCLDCVALMGIRSACPPPAMQSRPEADLIGRDGDPSRLRHLLARASHGHPGGNGRWSQDGARSGASPTTVPESTVNHTSGTRRAHVYQNTELAIVAAQYQRGRQISAASSQHRTCPGTGEAGRGRRLGTTSATRPGGAGRGGGVVSGRGSPVGNCDLLIHGRRGFNAQVGGGSRGDAHGPRRP